MSLMDKLMMAPPRGSSHKPEDSSHGGQPGKAVGHQLAEDERAMTSLDVQREAAERHVETLETEETAHPVGWTTPVEPPDNFSAETFTLQPGEVVEIVPRDPSREKLTVFNQSAAGGAAVALCATRRDAERGAKSFPPPRGVQVTPGGSVPRDMTHTAPVFAVCDPGAAAQAVIDVLAQRRAQRRP
jgi:hypothetical protein